MRKFDPVASKEEKPPEYSFDFDIINKQIDAVRLMLAEVMKDGVVNTVEYQKVISALEVLESLLISFLEPKDYEELSNSHKFFIEYRNIIDTGSDFKNEEEIKYGFGIGKTFTDRNSQILFAKHIKEYFRTMIKVSNRASFEVNNG